MNKLSPLHLLITRPPPAGKQLCQHLEAQGHRAIYFPTIAFSKPPDLMVFQEAITSLSSCEIWIFISPQAVLASVDAIRKAHPSLISQVTCAAMGRGTARVLQEAGFTRIVYPEQNESSEGLLALPLLHAVKEKHIAIIRGQKGREVLEKTLVERGAWLTPLIAYQRVLPNIDATPYRDLLKQNAIDAVICASYEGVKNLKYLLGEEVWSHLRKIPLIVVSERIKRLAHDLDFQTIWVAPHANHDALARFIAQKRKE